ncbi:MAG: HAD family hydrolase [Elusimicrobia bacterium]|nr:HAD family hydrolase [Elusimicrobiota bacterium]
MTQSECLQAVVAKVRELAGRGTRPVVLLDLDDTILSTTRRHARILREFAGEGDVASKWPEAAACLSVLEPPPHAYSVVDIAKSARVENPELLERLRSFWFARFFRSEYVIEDAAVPGAPEFCSRLAEAGALLAYVTGRDEAMRPGTEISLAQKGFPIPGRGDARLVLKPRFDTPDLQFKAEALERVSEWGPVAAGFENEPAHINLWAERFPEGRHVLVQTKHSGKPVDPHPVVGRIRDFLLTA